MFNPPPGSVALLLAARIAAAISRWQAKPSVRVAALFVYYLGITIALLLIYGRGDFTTAPFVYQGF